MTTTELEAVDARDARLQEARKWAERYAELKEAQYVTRGGEVLALADHKREVERLGKQLKAYIDAHGAIFLEGVGELAVQPRRGGVSYERPQDTLARDPDTFWRAFELGCAVWDGAAVELVEKRGEMVTLIPRNEMAGSPALVINKQGVRK